MRAFALSSLLLIGTLTIAQNPTFPPPETTHPVVTQIHTQLSQIVESKDYLAFADWLAPDVLSSLGGNGGIMEFTENWNIDEDASRLWIELERVLRLGGAFIETEYEIPVEDRSIVFPYLFNLELDDPDRFFEAAIITGSKVNVRSAPHLNSTVIDQFTYDVVWYVQEEGVQNTSGDNGMDEPAWYLVESYDRSTRGWVYWKYVRSPIDYRLVLSLNESGEWKIDSFVAGD